MEDPEGRIIGFDATGQLTSTIPNAMPIIPYQNGESPFEGYYLADPADYTVHVSGTASGVYSVTIFAEERTGFVLQDVSLGAATSDAVSFKQAGTTESTDGSAFVVSSNDTGKPLSVTLLRSLAGGSEQRTYALDNLTVGSGKPLSITTDSGTDSLIIEGGVGSSYDFCFQRQRAGQVPAEFCWGNLVLPDGDRHILTPENWDHLNDTRLLLEIDENGDGTIDQTHWLVGHGLVLSMQNEPSVIQSGDLLMFTLDYSVTGESVASSLLLTTSLPLSTTFVSATGGILPQGNVLEWNLGSLMPPASGQVAFTVEVDSIPDDAVIGTLATLRDDSGRWILASAAAPGMQIDQMIICLVDFDDSGQVDANDIQAVASRWQLTAANPNYETRYDVIFDGIINMQDIMTVSGYWNHVCQ
ncbi:MAG: dockerin type I domain-containing protein [Chloroflexota bacterium]|nr:dockerin type I domain-containing protein [Chloroflexota bacterium]